MEEWKIIEDYPNYSISNIGNIKNNKTGKFLKPSINLDGYLQLNLCNDGKRKAYRFHRLLALTFLQKIEGKNIVDHIDRNKLNNSLDNLRWVSISENNRNINKKNGTLSIYRGVSFHKINNKFISSIKINNKTIYLGRYKTEKEAAIAYNNYIIENNVSCAILNNITD